MLQRSSQFWRSAPMQDHQSERGYRGSRLDGSDSPVPGRVIYRHQPWLGRLLLLSLLVMLNMPVFFILTTGMDQYSFFAMGPLAAEPIPLLLQVFLNVLLSLVAYTTYRYICQRRSSLFPTEWGIFRQTGLAVGIPIALALLPSFLMCNTGGKAYYVIVGVLVTGSICITGSLGDSSVKLNPRLARLWFGMAIASVLVLLALASAWVMFFYFIEQIPATSNFGWQLDYRWSDLGYGPEEFPARQRDGLLVFGITGMGYMVLVLGGIMLTSILTRARLAGLAPPYMDPDSWGAQVLERLEEEAPHNGEERPYLAVFSGLETSISARQYERLVNGKASEILREADMVVDSISGNVSVRADGSWVNVDFRMGDTRSGGRSGPSLCCVYRRGAPEYG